MKREVKRVLLMLDYGPDDPSSGEVFDLTALVAEMLPKALTCAQLTVNVEASNTYAIGEDAAKYSLAVSFGGYAGSGFVSGATHLDDVVNTALPDGERVSGIKKKAARCRERASQLDRDAMIAKLAQVSDIRHQHPIARVTETAKLLEDGQF
jgi:hypothetical protein